jgi:hypothetical protein
MMPCSTACFSSASAYPAPSVREIADGGESGHQRRAKMIDGPCGAQAQRFLENLIVPAGLVVGMQQDVRVSFDQPGKQRRSGHLHDCGVGCGDGGARSGPFDALTADAHDPSVVHREAVEDARRLQDADRLGRLWRIGVRPQHRLSQNRADQKESAHW